MRVNSITPVRLPALAAVRREGLLPARLAVVTPDQVKRTSTPHRAGRLTRPNATLDLIVYRRGRWYAVGHCHLRKGLRSFRVDRIRSVRALDTAFERPADFDALAHLTFSVATLPRTFAVEVLLKTDLATARRELFETIGIFEPTADGVLLFGQTDNLGWFARELARLPFEFEIRRPPELRKALRETARALLVQARA